MNQFFSDSRKLFSENNVGKIDQALVKEDSEIGYRYRQYLGEYYSVKVSEDGAKWMDNTILGHYFHKTVDLKGNVVYLSGYYTDSKMAIGHLKFLMDCGIVKSELVKVTPTSITSIQ